jgi:purine-nucleoside phosphorylase
MPARLRPTAPIAADAILVGDPGRALLLAQELLQQPKMSNHARGLWGYYGVTPEGHELTIQSTGMGGPSASVVLQDLVELGVRRAIRIGTCTSLLETQGLGDLVVVIETFPEPRGPLRATGEEEEPREPVIEPDAMLTHRLLQALPDATGVVAVSLDVLHRPGQEAPPASEVADMQTAALFATASEFEVVVAALLIVSQTNEGEHIPDEDLEAAAKRAGFAAAGLFST